MLTIAYLANRYPSATEPYVGAEIRELRRRGVNVVAGSIWRAPGSATDAIYLMPIGLLLGLHAAWLCLWRGSELNDLLYRVLFEGDETVMQRAKALLHTWLGACYAIRLRQFDVRHIHVHHGYFGVWIAMVAARLLHVTVSMTLHGSDLLQHATFMDAKLANCARCFPISEFNRQHILAKYAVSSAKLVVARLGVSVPAANDSTSRPDGRLRLLCVGRLHAVKGHAFLVKACQQLRERDVAFECRLAGDGPERKKIDRQIGDLGLRDALQILGHVQPGDLGALYDWADVVVLTSQSEGIPVVLMEAMARGKIVVAPAITGIPELVRDGETGFLYTPGSMDSFLARILEARDAFQQEHSHGARPNAAASSLAWMRHAARVHVRRNYEQQTNLQYFAGMLEATANPQLEEAA